MKRTKQAYYRPNPTHQQTQDSSGLTFLIGQDRPFEDRTKQYQKLQKQYLDQQMKEKQQIKSNTKNTNNLFDQQLLENTKHRAQMEVQKRYRIFDMEKATDDHNLQMANQRKNRERQQKQRLIEQQRRQLDLLNQRKVKRVLPNQN